MSASGDLTKHPIYNVSYFNVIAIVKVIGKGHLSYNAGVV
jgi:hypothetical protein